MALGGGFPKRLAIGTAQFDQLRTLLSTVVGTNPFYTAKFDAAQASYKVRHLGEFSEFVPFTTKAEIISDQQNHPPYGTNLTFPLDRYTRLHQTSGTSGTPIRWLDTPESWQWLLGNWEQIYAAAGVRRGDRIFFAFSFGPFLGFWTAFESAARVGALCLPGASLSSAARLRAIFDHQANVLCCTPTYAVRLAEVAAAEKIDLNQSPVKLIIVAGEPGGSVPATRSRLEQLWPGARVFDHHGMTEVGPVTYECPERPGVLHVIETSYMAEVIQPQTGEPVGEGETGELVLTPLGRVGSPLLRYRTGDLVKPGPSGACQCGRHDLTLEGGILGRTDDMVIVRGVNIYPNAIEQIVRTRPQVSEYRVRILTRNALPEIELDIEAPSGDAAAIAQQLQTDFEAAFRLRIPVFAVAAGMLPRTEGKSQRFVHENTTSR